jgi:protein TonB
MGGAAPDAVANSVPVTANGPGDASKPPPSSASTPASELAEPLPEPLVPEELPELLLPDELPELPPPEPLLEPLVELALPELLPPLVEPLAPPLVDPPAPASPPVPDPLVPHIVRTRSAIGLAAAICRVVMEASVSRSVATSGQGATAYT